MTRKRNTPIWTLFISVFLLSACSSAEWPREDRNNLLDRCEEEGGTSSYCKCYLKNAMEKYPDPESMETIDFEEAVELSIGCE